MAKNSKSSVETTNGKTVKASKAAEVETNDDSITREMIDVTITRQGEKWRVVFEGGDDHPEQGEILEVRRVRSLAEADDVIETIITELCE